MASQLLRACSSLTVALERLKQHCGRLAIPQFQLESLLAFLVSSFVDTVASLVRNRVTAQRVRLVDVVASVTESIEMDLQSFVELSSTVERGV